ncbi:hypothetical protein [Buchnera aphidicola]
MYLTIIIITFIILIYKHI